MKGVTSDIHHAVRLLSRNRRLFDSFSHWNYSGIALVVLSAQRDSQIR
jgi:hypothetical protein